VAGSVTRDEPDLGGAVRHCAKRGRQSYPAAPLASYILRWKHASAATSSALLSSRRARPIAAERPSGGGFVSPPGAARRPLLGTDAGGRVGAGAGGAGAPPRAAAFQSVAAISIVCLLALWSRPPAISILCSRLPPRWLSVSRCCPGRRLRRPRQQRRPITTLGCRTPPRNPPIGGDTAADRRVVFRASGSHTSACWVARMRTRRKRSAVDSTLARRESSGLTMTSPRGIAPAAGPYVPAILPSRQQVSVRQGSAGCQPAGGNCATGSRWRTVAILGRVVPAWSTGRAAPARSASVAPVPIRASGVLAHGRSPCRRR
jgi:hypothetical protein